MYSKQQQEVQMKRFIDPEPLEFTRKVRRLGYLDDAGKFVPVGNIKHAAVDQFVMSDGSPGMWTSVYSAGGGLSGVFAVMLTPDNKFVLNASIQFPVSTPSEAKYSIETPGGAINQGENPWEAAAREGLEETGYQGEFVREPLVASMDLFNGKFNNRSPVYLVKNCRQIQQPVPDPVERYLRIETILLTAEEIMYLIAHPDPRISCLCHFPLYVAICAMIAKGMVAL